ncbi:hypothetical protein [Dyadobacter sp. NIV53]|uniref:hypothetical protein n=1 Tax=Dyadobacter sp. NIV53 TaxID=2861765 RepID=UPI001C889F21|nr:hypothetical protein [Dyadobacter sp. NIV53]
MVEEIIDLLEDPNFKIWIESPNEFIDEYWQNILREFPEKKESIDKARAILQAINTEFTFDFPEEEEVNRMLRKIFYQISNPN